MIIRQAVLSDAEAIAELAGQLGYPTAPEEARERLTTVVEKKGHEVYVAEMPGDGVAGWVHVFGTYRLVAEPFAEIGGLIVDEYYRGVGVGKALLERAEKWAQDQGYRVLRIRSNTVRAGAYAFYERMGYHCAKTQNVFVKAFSRTHQEM